MILSSEINYFCTYNKCSLKGNGVYIIRDRVSVRLLYIYVKLVFLLVNPSPAIEFWLRQLKTRGQRGSSTPPY